MSGASRSPCHRARPLFPPHARPIPRAPSSPRRHSGALAFLAPPAPCLGKPPCAHGHGSAHPSAPLGSPGHPGSIFPSARVPVSGRPGGSTSWQLPRPDPPCTGSTHTQGAGEGEDNQQRKHPDSTTPFQLGSLSQLCTSHHLVRAAMSPGCEDDASSRRPLTGSLSASNTSSGGLTPAHILLLVSICSDASRLPLYSKGGAFR